MTEGNGPPRAEQPASTDALGEFKSQLESWSEKRLRPYLLKLDRQLGKSPLRLDAKEINDAVWGTIVLRPLEILVLDSPLLQRLRTIRQLGVVHLVYPSGLHTRFEHSIGAVHQVSRVITSINSHSGEPHPIIDRSFEDLLRLTALCHDVGHGLMSHVSENALKHFSDVEALRLDFAEFVDAENVAMSEIAAYFIIGSPAFRELINTSEALLRSRDLPPSAADLIQDCVLGKQISQDIPLLHELISGPFDADKLDYMTRDAEMTGVPVVTDIPRLVQKVRAVDLPINELPSEIQVLVKDDRASYWLTGIAMSGGRTLDELLIGRTFLFDKLYRHQKVRAAEAMVAAIFREVAALCADGPAMMPYLLSDEELVELDRASVDDLARRALKPDEVGGVEVAIDIASRLRRRELFVRSYAFAQNMPLDPYRADRAHAQGLRALSAACADEIERSELVEEIVDHLKRILAALGETGLLDDLPGKDPEPYVWLDPPQPPTGGTVISQAYLLGGARRWLRFAEDAAEAPGWTNAYLLTRDTGYVFTNAELASSVFLATERVVRERFDVRTPKAMYGYANQDETEIDECRARLANAGYYADAPFDLRPRPDRLRKGDVPVRLAAIAERFAGYQGPVSTEDAREDKSAAVITPARIDDWVRQFQDDELIDAALRMLDHTEFVGRSELVRGLDDFLAANEAFRGASLCRLGTLQDSSSILVYQALDAGANYGLRLVELGTALLERTPIIFVDDFVGRGAQSITIFENWLDEPLSFDLGEDRGPPLSPSARDALREVPIAVVFSSGTGDGAKALEQRLGKLQLNATVLISHNSLPSAHEGRIYANPAQKDLFLERCRDIGRELLLQPESEHDEKWVEDKSLGYGGDAFLIVFPYNTPSQTLTCLWASGAAQGIKWQPLFPRRKKA